MTSIHSIHEICCCSLRPWDPQNDVVEYESNYMLQTQTRIPNRTPPSKSLMSNTHISNGSPEPVPQLGISEDSAVVDLHSTPTDQAAHTNSTTIDLHTHAHTHTDMAPRSDMTDARAHSACSKRDSQQMDSEAEGDNLSYKQYEGGDEGSDAELDRSATFQSAFRLSRPSENSNSHWNPCTSFFAPRTRPRDCSSDRDQNIGPFLSFHCYLACEARSMAREKLQDFA